MIDLKLLDFLDTKLIETRKNTNMKFGERLAVYNLIIDIQEFLKTRLDEDQRGVRYDENC
jgi:hypothetical protein